MGIPAKVTQAQIDQALMVLGLDAEHVASMSMHWGDRTLNVEFVGLPNMPRRVSVSIWIERERKRD